MQDLAKFLLARKSNLARSIVISCKILSLARSTVISCKIIYLARMLLQEYNFLLILQEIDLSCKIAICI